jgi:hypothetical protein
MTVKDIPSRPTADALLKPVPARVMMVVAVPTETLEGLTLVSVGVGYAREICAEFDLDESD